MPELPSLSREVSQSAGLSKAQEAVFACLAAVPNQLVRRAELLALIKGRSPKTIHSHIMDIRKKLRDHGLNVTIETVAGTGYILRL